ncbi:protein of unknown function (plasmid) [Rhodovastum atsumiense]|nr:protein of unknown function [Rhodovastum atsumiense]
MAAYHLSWESEVITCEAGKWDIHRPVWSLGALVWSLGALWITLAVEIQCLTKLSRGVYGRRTNIRI